MSINSIIENLPFEVASETFQDLFRKEYILYKLAKEKDLKIGDPSCPYFLFFGNVFSKFNSDELSKIKFKEGQVRHILKKYFQGKEDLKEILAKRGKESLIYVNIDLPKVARKSFKVLH